MKQVLIADKVAIFGIVFVSLLSFASARQSTSISIVLSPNDQVSENINLAISSNDSYDLVDFVTFDRPSSVSYAGNYSAEQGSDGTYHIYLAKKIYPGNDSLNFSMLYDGIVERSANDRVLRMSFQQLYDDYLKVDVILPPHYTLSRKEPNAVPAPSRISTNGRSIMLSWNFSGADSTDISIFYKGDSGGDPNYSAIIAISVILVVASGMLAFVHFRKKAITEIEELLSGEELKILEQIKSGVKKQKEIAESLEFSKSKMSKLARRLEEKGLIERKPHFKTNLLEITAKIK